MLKAFRGSISGDGPRHRFNNGLTIRRNRNTRRFEIHAIDHVILSAIIPNYSCRIGDNIIELNGLNVANMTLPEVNGILSREVLNSISTTANTRRVGLPQPEPHIESQIPVLNRSYNQLIEGTKFKI